MAVIRPTLVYLIEYTTSIYILKMLGMLPLKPTRSGYIVCFILVLLHVRSHRVHTPVDVCLIRTPTYVAFVYLLVRPNHITRIPIWRFTFLRGKVIWPNKASASDIYTIPL